MIQQKELEEKVISSISSPEDLSDMVISGITSEYFVLYKDVFEFIQKHSSKYGKIPSKSILQANHPNLVWVDGAEDDKDYLISELERSDVQRRAIRVLNHGADLVAQDVYGGIDFLLSKLQGIRKTDKKYCISYTDKDAMKRLDEFKERREKLSKGLQLGLRTGFSVFDDNNIGWLPGNLVAVIGRLGMGKSWLSLYSGCSAYANGHKVVYLSPEMSVQEVELRWDTLMARFYDYKFSNEELVLGKSNEKKYEEWLKKVSEKSNWVTMDSNHGKPFTIPSIESIVQEFQPDLLCVDGFLELRSTDSKLDKSWEVMLDVAYGLKAIAQTHKTVVMVTSQANRGAAGKMPEIQDIYGGDALAQASDLCMMMSDGENEPNVRYVSIPKRRGGKSYTKKIKLSFDVDRGCIGG